MIRLLLILSTLVLSTLFLYYNGMGEMGFLFSDYMIPGQTWFYFLFEHLILVILAYVILTMETRYRAAAVTFLVIQIIDTIDYVLTYGEPWFDSKIVTWNTLKVGIFGIAIIYERYGR